MNLEISRLFGWSFVGALVGIAIYANHTAHGMLVAAIIALVRGRSRSLD